MLTFQFIILQIIVFSAVVYFLKKILYGDTESAIKRLGIVYQDLLQKQKELSEKIDAAQKEYDAKKEEAAAIADKMSSEAMDEVRKKEDEILKKARSEAEEIIQKAHTSEEQFYHDIELKVEKKMVDFCGELFRNVFDENMRAVIHAAMVKDFTVKIKDADFSSVGEHPELVLNSAFELTSDEFSGLKDVFDLKLKNPSLKIEKQVDPKLISGIRLQFGTLVLDGSLASLLRETSTRTKEKMV